MLMEIVALLDQPCISMPRTKDTAFLTIFTFAQTVAAHDAQRSAAKAACALTAGDGMQYRDIGARPRASFMAETSAPQSSICPAARLRQATI